MNRMITTYNQPRFLSRIFTDASGRRFRLTFLVAVVNGELKGRLVSAEPLSSSAFFDNLQLAGNTASVDRHFCLPIFCTENKPDTRYIPALAPVVSPYFSLEFLINSQPTRAPAYK